MSQLSHLCPVCQQSEWHPLDHIVTPCPKCQGNKVFQVAEDKTVTCDLCQGHGKVNFMLRNQKYWFSLDYLYNEAVGMKVCKGCGFVTYEPRWTEEQLRERYTKERGVLNAQLMVKANMKNEFHRRFLQPELLPFEGEGTVLDIGCSFGAIRDIFPRSTIYGIEYASRLAKYAKEVNRLNVINDTEELSYKSVDLVMMYHTLEHVSDPRATLMECRRVLADGGYLYVAVPDYFGKLREVSGQACLDFERLYHLNHNNVFSHTSFNNLLRQCGFEVIKSHNEYYGEAVLCRKNDTVDKNIQVENWQQIENILYRQRIAIDIVSKCHKDQDGDKAMMGIEAALANYSQYSDAYEAMMVQKSKFKDPVALLEVYERACSAGAETIHLRDRFASALLNWCDAGQINNNVRKSEELFKKSLEIFPGDIEALSGLMKINAYHYKNSQAAQEYADRLIKINPISWGEVQNILAQMRCLE